MHTRRQKSTQNHIHVCESARTKLLNRSYKVGEENDLESEKRKQVFFLNVHLVLLVGYLWNVSCLVLMKCNLQFDLLF